MVSAGEESRKVLKVSKGSALEPRVENAVTERCAFRSVSLTLSSFSTQGRVGNSRRVGLCDPRGWFPLGFLWPVSIELG